MEVILTTDIPKLGHAGDVVTVKPGYGRNYLLPQGKALLATRGRVAELEHKRRVIEELQKKEIQEHGETAQRLAGVELQFEVRAGEEGKLFGSVTSADIAGKLREKGFEIERRKIELTDPIKQIGDYEVPIRLHREVAVAIPVHVVPLEGAPIAPPEEMTEGDEQEAEEEI